MAQQRVLNVGLIGGGGSKAFFGGPHQRAIHQSGTRRVVAGALRSSPQAALEAAENWPYPIRGYPTWQKMLVGERSLPEGERVDYVTIVTPNHQHIQQALGFIVAGIPVFCEKPMTRTVTEASILRNVVLEMAVPFGLAHTYLGHLSLRLARHIVRTGLIGEVRWVDASYLQGWLARPIEQEGQQQASWRTDPEKAGASCCGGDIGTHALMALRYVTGLEVTAVSARLESFVPGRVLDDHFTALVELSNNGKGLVRASQIAIGHNNDHRLEINGTEGTILWSQEESEKLVVMPFGKPEIVYWRGAVSPLDVFLGVLPQELLAESTLPAGHGEAFHDALGRLHGCFERVVRAYHRGEPWVCDGSQFATVEDGLIGMKFIEAAVKSSQKGGRWVRL